jgi:hypothetical protein
MRQCVCDISPEADNFSNYFLLRHIDSRLPIEQFGLIDDTRQRRRYSGVDFLRGFR